jgi:hypothetical protein
MPRNGRTIREDQFVAVLEASRDLESLYSVFGQGEDEGAGEA